MKNSINFYDHKKARAVPGAKKSNYMNSLIYKELVSHHVEGSGKIKNNR